MSLKNELPDSPLIQLVGMDCVSDTDPGAVKLINSVETELAEKLGDGTRGYAVGDFPVVFSRNNRRDSPVWDHLATGEPIRRILDKPKVTGELIDITVRHVQNTLGELLKEHPTHTTSRARLPHRMNEHRHVYQPATLLSYIMRTFCHDSTPALFPNPEHPASESEIRNIIRTLPLDPAKISDEILKKMGLAPEDYETYTLQARLRYKLWIRPRFLEIFAHAHIVERSPTLTSKGKTTARLISFKTEAGEKKAGIFGTTTDMYDHVTGIAEPRHHRRKISDTSFRIPANFGALLRSQEHAIVKLSEKGIAVKEYLALFEDYANMSMPERYELACDVLEYFMQKNGFHEDKIVDFVKKLPKNPSMVGNINQTLRQLLSDIRGKIHEIDSTYCLLLGKWDRFGNRRT